MTSKPKDQAQRDKAAIPGGYNVIVEAGAGTGKTTLLTDRLCYLILGQNTPIDKIIALTFTEKAAAEIKVKLLIKMQQIRAELGKENSEHQTTLTLLNRFKKSKEQLLAGVKESFELAERAQISTIHSFCYRLLRRYPLEAGLSPQSVIDEGAAMQTLFDKAWAAFLEGQLIYGAAAENQWRQALRQITLEEIKDYAQTLLNPALENYHPFTNFAAVKERCETYAAQAAELAARHPVLRGKTRDLETYLAKAAGILKECALYYQNPSPEITTETIDKIPDQPKNWPDEDYGRAEEILDFAQSMTPQNQRLILLVFNLIKPFLADVKGKLEKENIISYDEVIEKTRTLLKNNKAARRELKKEYKSILIDEFQDTDPAQGEILLFLAEEETGAAQNWREIKLAQGKLFTVGDPKQSIYRFRGADIEAYQQFTDLMFKQGAQKCFLQTNFRSSANIIAFANAFGQASIKEQSGVQSAYVPIENGKDFGQNKVLIAAFESDEAGAEDYRRNQAQFIAVWIKENAYKTKLKDGRPMRYKDIAILLRSRTGSDIYQEALARFDIKYTTEDSGNFYKAQEVSDFINLLAAVNDPRDKTALLAVLRSPFGMMEDGEILALSRAGKLDIYAEVEDNPKAKRVFGIIKDLYFKAGRVSLDELLKEIIYNTCFTELQTLAAQSEQALANIYKFISVTRASFAGGVLSLGQFLDFAQKYSKEQKKEGQTPLAEESADTLTITTMHKAKGLEYPVVILADLSRKSEKGRDKQPKYLYNWRENVKGVRLKNMPDAPYALLRENIKNHQTAEELRVLYVALTRAKEQLILAGNLKEEKHTITAALNAGACWPNAQTKPQQLGPAQALYLKCAPPETFENKTFFTAGVQEHSFDIAAWRAAWQQRANEYEEINKTPGALAPSAAARGAQPAQAPGESRAAAAGAAAHKMLYNIFNDIQNPPAPDEESKEAQTIIEHFVKTDLFKELKQMRLLAAEMPFTFKDKTGRIISGVIDAVFETKEGNVFIADYKSDKIEKENIKERSLMYKTQLEYYKAAAQIILPGAQITTALIYLRPAEKYIF
ncbi:MAG: UvrD-helicase domain-containing protein [Elusimicrobiota bacterium]|jgi:ATP-dependent helicase/nuclease subunit A|nr:UvrD-helicase domain-containing protein [Elusimicrobiota bacterium]